MKSPRDILLERHRHQLPALDRIRESVVATERETDSTLLDRIREWCRPQTLAWSSLAVAWIAIVTLNLAARGEAESPVANGSRMEAGAILNGLQEYHTQLAALLKDQTVEREPATSSQPPVPRPRSDAHRPRRDALHLNTAFA